MKKSQLRRIIREEVINELSAGEEAKKRGLKHVGWGRYADQSGKVVAKSEKGKLVALKRPEEPTKNTMAPRGAENPFKMDPQTWFYQTKHMPRADQEALAMAGRFHGDPQWREKAQMASSRRHHEND